MTVSPTTPIFDDKNPGGDIPGKISEFDPRVQAWATAEFESDSLIVRFAPNVSRQEAEATIALEVPGTTVTDWDDELQMAFLELPADSDEIDLGHRFLRLTNTLYAEPNFVMHTRATVPDDPGFPEQWALNNTGQQHFGIAFPTLPTPPATDPSGLDDADIDAPEAWDLTTGSPDVVVAVLDTGVHIFNDDLNVNFWQNPREIPDLIDNDGNGYVDDIFGADPADGDGDPADGDPLGHGTRMASIIAAGGNNGDSTTGVAWNSKIMPVKISTSGGTSITVTGAIGGYKYVHRMKSVYGVNIVAANASYGSSSYSFAEFDAVEKMTNAGVLLVTSVSNTGVNQDIVRDYPSSYDIDGIISVSASDDFDFPISGGGFLASGFGRATVDIHAPGYEIFTQTMPYSVTINSITVTLNVDVYSGTSYAAAHVSGVAALVNSLAPGLTPVEVKQYIMAGVDKRNAFRFLSVTEGRLNARGALDAIPKNTLQGTVFQDANNNKIYDSIGETGLAGWTVYLDVDNDGVLDANEPSTLSSATGTYSLDAYVRPGSYRVRQVLQPNFTQTTPTTNGGSHLVNLVNRSVDFVNLNFGNRQQPGSIVGHKFNDLDANGAQDPGEPGLAGIMVYVDLNDNGFINVGEPFSRTGTDGNFVIPNIQPGTYSVREIITPGYIPTVPATLGANNLPDPVLSVTVVSNIANDPPLLFGNRVAFDYGDLPQGGALDVPVYNTLIANNGPSHGILPGFMLGTKQDFELDGIPTIGALGDDLTPDQATGDDEDGVQFVKVVPGEDGMVNITVTNSGNAAGLLQGWIDFNLDGDFSDPGEQIFKNRTLADGVNNGLTFTIPAGATTADTYARFRYAYERDLGPDGPARAGEVEDYLVDVFTAAPVARSDEFPDQLFEPPVVYTDLLIKQESTNNVLDVLRNDPLPFAGTLSIIPGSFPSTTANGSTITLDTVDQVLIYTPGAGANPFTGVETFTYQVTNGINDPGTGQPYVSAPATVRVLVTAKDPIAVDDTRTTIVDTAISIPVLANDVNTPSAPISVLSFTQPASGTVTPDIVNPGQVIYTPAVGFIGTVQFQYTVTDADLSTLDSTATVTVQVANNPVLPPATSYKAKISLRVFDSLDREVGVDPMARIDVGDVFYVRAYSEDLRPGGSNLDRGVEAAFLDLLYDSDFAAVNVILVAGEPENDIVFNPLYNFDKNAIVNSPQGIINELGAAHNSTDPPLPNGQPLGTGEVLIATIGFNATAATTNLIFRPDPAEDSQGRSDILLAPAIGQPNPVLAADTEVFLVESVPVTIKTPGAPEFINTRSSLDVNNDTKITAFDALSVINELNISGARRLGDYYLAVGGEMPPSTYVDTNGDGGLSAFDALAVINWLNLHPISGGGTGGEAVSGGEAISEASSFVLSGGEAVGSSEESGSIGTVVTPVLFAVAGDNQASSGSEVSPVGSSISNDDSQLLYLSAVDQLMSLTGDDDNEESNSSTDSNNSMTADWLSVEQLRIQLRG